LQVDWIYWTQTSSSAYSTALANRVIVSSQAQPLYVHMLDVITNVTCDGAYVSSLYGCVSKGTICSNQGTCNSGMCSCNPGYTGSYCQSPLSQASSSSVLAPILASILAVIFLLVLLLILAGFLFFFLSRRKRTESWEISIDEIQKGDLLGEVYKATWKGSEVAVKCLPADNLSKAAIANFAEEATTMSHLRHPNVVLFMAACTKPPNMCIVMEFMALGSLYDLIHNDLIPDIPIQLKVKIIYQAAKGMHFLHSSGIVHRDLKSLNLLLDSKWNVKVSDFGLTRLKSSIKAGRGEEQMQGSVPWMSPEVLEEKDQIDYCLADVYSFGIIMWEVLTRDVPYAGMIPAQIAVAVIKLDIRPAMSQSIMAPLEYKNLMTSCWHYDPPVSLEIAITIVSLFLTLLITSR